MHKLISTSVLNVFGPFFLFTRVRDCTYTRSWVRDCTCLMWATVHVHAGVRVTVLTRVCDRLVLARVRDCTYSCAWMYLSSVRDFTCTRSCLRLYSCDSCTCTRGLNITILACYT
jgi:hypothetical protein